MRLFGYAIIDGTEYDMLLETSTNDSAKIAELKSTNDSLGDKVSDLRANADACKSDLTTARQDAVSLRGKVTNLQDQLEKTQMQLTEATAIDLPSIEAKDKPFSEMVDDKMADAGLSTKPAKRKPAAKRRGGKKS